MLTLYGIRNCDTVKKARAWLDAAAVPYEFHDFKAAGVAAPVLADWVAKLGWETVLNRAGTTFRALPGADKAGIDAARATALMLVQPSMIKRPVVAGDFAGRPFLTTGFKPETWAVLFNQAPP